MKTLIAFFVVAHLGFLGVYKMMEEKESNPSQIIVPDGWIITTDRAGTQRKLISPDGIEYKLEESSFIKDGGVILESLGYPAVEMGWY